MFQTFLCALFTPRTAGCFLYYFPDLRAFQSAQHSSSGPLAWTSSKLQGTVVTGVLLW